MRRIVVTIPAALAAALTLAACGSSGSGGSANGAGTASGSTSSVPYRVMVTGGLSAQGVLAANSETSVLAAKAGAKEVNAQGGIDGHRVVLTVADDGGNPSTAVTDLLDAIHSGNKPDLYLNSGPSTISAAVLPILKANDILSFNNGQTSTSSIPADFPLNFDVPGPPDQVQGFVTAINAAGYKKVGIIHGSDAYGVPFSNSLKAAFVAAGLDVTSDQQYDETALSMTPELQAIQATKPDVLVMDAYGPPVGYLLNSLQQLGWNIPVLADASSAATSLLSTAPPAGYVGTALVKNVKMEVMQSTVYTPSDAGVNIAVKAMNSLGKIEANLLLAFNYDAFPLVAAAAKAANSIDSTAIAGELVNPSVLARAHTVMLSRYNYTTASHDPHAAGSASSFISPSRVVDGQFGHVTNGA